LAETVRAGTFVQIESAVARGVVQLEPQTPERLRTTLPIDPPHPLLGHFSRLHTTERTQRRENLEGQAPVFPDDKAGAPRVHVAQQVPRTEVAIGHPQVTRLHRLEDTTDQRALLRMAIFARANITYHPLSRCRDHQRLPR